jgi:FKBP-type peptidyl-prolyl cis-trans isomerase
MKYLLSLTILLVAMSGQVSAFSMSMSSEGKSNRRSSMAKVSSSAAAAATVAATSVQTPQVANAAPTIYNLPSGIKYAVLKESDKKLYPQSGDIVATEYTGYLMTGWKHF